MLVDWVLSMKITFVLIEMTVTSVLITTLKIIGPFSKIITKNVTTLWIKIKYCYENITKLIKIYVYN